MKKLICLLCFFSPVIIYAQSNANEYLLESFIISIATMKQGAPIRASFNYDCTKQEMHFEEDGEIFKLQDINTVDTLFLGNYKMIPYAGRFLDVVYITSQYKLLFDYKIKKTNKGKKGAMGTATQGTVETIDFSKSGIASQQVTVKDNTVYDYKDESTYYLELNGKKERIKDAKSFVKLFPAKKEQIETYIKEHKVTFKDMDAIISLIEFSLN